MMTNSYLGIITTRGLETLVVETDHAAPFLFRRLSRYPRGEAFACWAILKEKTAHDLLCQIVYRRFQDALWQLNAQALDLGTLLPPLRDEDLLRSAQ